MWRDSSRIAAPKTLPPPWCGPDIGVVILLEDAAVGEQRRRRVADQLHVVRSAKYLDRCFPTFSAHNPEQCHGVTGAQNVAEFTSRYLTIQKRGQSGLCVGATRD